MSKEGGKGGGAVSEGEEREGAVLCISHESFQKSTAVAMTMRAMTSINPMMPPTMAPVLMLLLLPPKQMSKFLHLGIFWFIYFVYIYYFFTIYFNGTNLPVREEDLAQFGTGSLQVPVERHIVVLLPSIS